MKLFISLILKDLKKNKVITAVLVLFLFLSALLMTGGLRVAGTMISSLKGLNEAAIPPDYMRMHKGGYDENKVQSFVEEHDCIEDFLTVKMLNISNSSIYYQGESFEKCLMDNGFVVQNRGFDYLMDTSLEMAIVGPGEIGVPVYYAEELGIQVGDSITLKEGSYQKKLSVTTLIRDASMNAALASSKRFLINQEDLDEICKNMGDWEYCFSFLLKDGTSTAMLETDYLNANLPSNGVAVTVKLLNLLNGFSYGLVAFIILSISILLIIIAILCLTYIIGATMADENQTIGQMKAIGFSGQVIGRLFLVKYLALVVGVGLLGYLAAIPFENYFSASVVKFCGNGNEPWLKWLFSLSGMFLFLLLVVVKCQRAISRNVKKTVMELLWNRDKTKNEGHFRLPVNGFLYGNVTMALGDLRCKWKEYRVLFFVFVFSTFLLLLPMNITNTISNPSFITYMGVGECDIRIDIQYNDDIVIQKQKVLELLEKDKEISKYAIFKNGYVQCQNAKNEWEYMRVISGEESVFPLSYLSGDAPENANEMALSYMNAQELEKKTGDEIIISYGEEKKVFLISGIYQDITYGGKTAKAAIDFLEKDTEVTIIYLDVKKGISLEAKTKELRSVLTDSKVTLISEFIDQTLGGVVKDMKMVQNTSQIISILLNILITFLFLQLITAREHSAIAIKKAVGFSNQDIRLQFGIRIFFIQFVAIIAGTILANVLGEAVFGALMSTMGISKIEFLLNPVMAFLVCPLLQIFTVVISVVLGTRVVRKYHIRDQIME